MAGSNARARQAEIEAERGIRPPSNGRRILGDLSAFWVARAECGLRSPKEDRNRCSYCRPHCERRSCALLGGSTNGTAESAGSRGAAPTHTRISSMKIASISAQSALLTGKSGLEKLVIIHPGSASIGLNPDTV